MSLSGRLTLKLRIERTVAENEGELGDREKRNDSLPTLRKAYGLVNALLDVTVNRAIDHVYDGADKERDERFAKRVAPGIARNFIDRLELFVKDKPVKADFTLVSSFRQGARHEVHFNVMQADLKDSQTRPEDLEVRDIERVKIKADSESPLFPNSIASVTDMQVDWTSETHSGSERQGRRSDDLVVAKTGEVEDTGAEFLFQLDESLFIDPFEEKEREVAELTSHLNAHAHYYHKVIWRSLDEDFLYTLLDAHTITVPSGDGAYADVSLASVCGREPLGIVGNSLVFPVAAGNHLEFGGFESHEALRRHYLDDLPTSEPIRLSLPTDGLYARAIMDECNACEEHHGSTDWVLSDELKELIAVEPSLLVSRRAEPQGLDPTEVDTIINFPGMPALPSSQLAGAISAVSNPNAFRDMTGLVSTQEQAGQSAQLATSQANQFGKLGLDAAVAKMQHAENMTKLDAGQYNKKVADIKKRMADGTISQEVGRKAVDELTRGLAKSATSEAGSSGSLAEQLADNVPSAAEVSYAFDDGQVSERLTLAQAERSDLPSLAGAVAGPGGQPVGSGFPIADQNPLDADTIVSHPYFQLPTESTLREIFPGTDSVEGRIGEEERQRATSRGYWFTASILHRATPDAAVMAPISLLTYLIFDFPVGENDISAEDLQPLRSLLERRANALRDRNLQLQIDILGTADETGPDEINDELRVQRAQRVAELLGSVSYRIRYIGPSDAPIAPETNELGRALNRSVTVHESVEQLGGTSIRRMPDDIEDIKNRTREKLQKQADAGDLDADIGLSVLDLYDQRTGQLSVLMKDKVREYYNEYVPNLAKRHDTPLYRADLFFIDGRAEIDNTLSFAPNAALTTDTELAADDLVLTIKVLAAATYEGINLHIQFSGMDRADSTVDPWDRMTQEIRKRRDNPNSVYGRAFDKYKDALDSPDLTF